MQVFLEGENVKARVQNEIDGSTTYSVTVYKISTDSKNITITTQPMQQGNKYVLAQINRNTELIMVSFGTSGSLNSFPAFMLKKAANGNVYFISLPTNNNMGISFIINENSSVTIKNPVLRASSYSINETAVAFGVNNVDGLTPNQSYYNYLFTSGTPMGDITVPNVTTKPIVTRNGYGMLTVNNNGVVYEIDQSKDKIINATLNIIPPDLHFTQSSTEETILHVPMTSSTGQVVTPSSSPVTIPDSALLEIGKAKPPAEVTIEYQNTTVPVVTNT